jgi:hypothetical protein
VYPCIVNHACMLAVGATWGAEYLAAEM